MAAPTEIIVDTDNGEYSRFEASRDEVLVTLSIVGGSLVGEEIQLQLRKARRNRDEIVTSRVITLATNGAHAVQTTFKLKDILDDYAVPKVRRGEYYFHAISLTNTDIVGDSDDFRVSLITTEQMKQDYLHGAVSTSSQVTTVVDQPSLITGVTIDEVSLQHPRQTFVLSYNYVVTAPPSVEGVTSDPFALANGQTLVLRINGGDAQTVTFNTGSFSNIAAATADEVADVINATLTGLVAADAGSGALLIAGDTVEGTNSIYVDSAGTATTALGLLNQNSTSTVVRTLSWGGGPAQTIVPGTRSYTLRNGNCVNGGATSYVKVRVSSIALLPVQSHAEPIMLIGKPMDDAAIQAILERAVSWVEDVALGLYIEPTRLVTETDPDAIVFEEGESTPTLQGADWDKIVNGLTYTAATAGHWMAFKSPYFPLLYFEQLYGKISNVRIVDIALEWIEHHERTGFVELVPFNQETAFNFQGLVWWGSLRGPIPLPNFWQFTAMVGFRETPGAILELIAKKAAIDILTIAGQGFKGGVGSQAISRDGVSESVSYTAHGMFGLYSAATETYKKWIDTNLKILRGAYLGPNLIVI